MTREEIWQRDYDLKHRMNEDGVKEKQCALCKDWKILNDSNFFKVKIRYGFSSRCKSCYQKYQIEHKEEQSIRFKSWHQKNKERMNAKCRQWMKDNKDHYKEYYKKWQTSEIGRLWCNAYGNERRITKGHQITKKEWAFCKVYFDEECCYCGIPQKAHRKIVGQDFHKDHADHEGENDLSNCVPSCRLCNSEKHDKPFEDWFNEHSNENFTQLRLDKINKWLTEDYKEYIKVRK